MKQVGSLFRPWSPFGGFAGVSLFSWFLACQRRGLPGIRDTIPNSAGSGIRLRRRVHARAETVRRQILNEHGVVEWAADLIRDAENNGSVRLRPRSAFRHHLLAASLNCLLGFFGSLIPILETRPLAVSKHNTSGRNVEYKRLHRDCTHGFK
jgi:hypothetical protein